MMDTFQILAMKATSGNDDSMEFTAVLLFFGAILLFLTTLLRMLLGYKLKKKAMDSGLGDNAIEKLVRAGTRRDRDNVIKWSFLLIGAGVGFFIIDASPTLGLRSLGIMSLCIATSFLGYSLYQKKSER